MPITPQELARWRLHTLGLSSPGEEAPGEIVRRLGAVQSQDYAPALWSLAQRRAAPLVREVEKAFASGDLIRTHVLRPTWHFVAPGDLRWLLGITAPRVHIQNGHQYRALELDEVILDRSHLMLSELLRGRQATRREIQTALNDEGVDAEGLRFLYILMYAELEGLICSGAPVGKQQTYALVEERIPPSRSLDDDMALGEMVRRYFTGHGPATVKDLRWWSSLTLAQIEKGLETARDELEWLESDGETYWFTIPPPPAAPVQVRAWLLQAYDEYIVGYQHTRGAIDATLGDVRLLSTLPGMPNAGVFIDGQSVGRWRRASSRDRIGVEVILSRDLSPEEMEALRVAVDYYGQAHEGQAELTLRVVS